MPHGECDACGKRDVALERGICCGIETYACAECFGYDADKFDEENVP